MISIVIPTVPGREEFYERCVKAYREHTSGEYEIVTEYDHPSVGLAWQAGAEKCRGDYIHLTADDIEPRPGWHAPAVEAVRLGFIPAPQVYDPSGMPQSHPLPGVVSPDWSPVQMSALPFCSRPQWEKIAPLLVCHYYTDDFFSWRAAQAGWRSRLRTGYSFTHWWAQHRRGAGMSEPERMRHDAGLYQEARRRVEAGQWTEPWPEAGR